jgi:hypothetical protein
MRPVASSGKWLRFAFATAVFLAVLCLTYIVHVRFFAVDVVFYGALGDGALALVLSALLLRLRAFDCFGGFEKGQVILAWGLLAYAFAISVPTVIDRSLSFYMLEKMQQHGGSLRQDRFEDMFTRGYAREHQLVAVRLTEQLASGTVTVRNGCVRLTARGDFLASFSRWFRRNLLPRQRLLMGSYTDALTDPFRGGQEDRGAACGPDDVK